MVVRARQYHDPGKMQYPFGNPRVHHQCGISLRHTNPFKSLGTRVPPHTVDPVRWPLTSPNGGNMITFKVLGQLEVIGSAGNDLTPSAPRVKSVLALLALDANRVVSTDALAEELWDDKPPRSAATTLQTYVYQIRRML